MDIIPLFYLFLAVLFLVIFGGFGLISWQEGEQRARNRSALIAGLGAALSLCILLLPLPVQKGLCVFFFFLFLAAAALYFLPIGKVSKTREAPNTRQDEREIMFARARLEPGSPAYKEYYRLHPEHKNKDDETRAKPGLLSPQAQFTDLLHTAATEASFQFTETLRHAVDGPLNPDRKSFSSQEMTAYIKTLAKYYGALDVGITHLKPYHIYTHIGRGSGSYGAPVELPHTHAIAFTVEMDFEMTRAAPYPPLTMESGMQYGQAAQIAVQLASAIRNLGYQARAHIDGNYRVIAPLVARDAGLGEIGRMGILMTDGSGPRVRLGAVTTTLALETDSYTPNTAVIDFCNICQKCAQNCPSQSIPFGPRKENDGALQWKINPDSCFRYWTVVGTDCGRCMSVCPFSHPNTFAHRLIRRGIKGSGLFRRFALWMDDFFYGTSPSPKYSPNSFLPHD
ncbi:MAG: 4Fe-4S dicluster domain-containing protein [Anaerolineales bacterium]|nr:4Fe-4S dicluster domain-containing protein [Anaerolineales bacterium]